MKGITIKVPDIVARQLREQARRSGRSIGALVRERIEAPPPGASLVYAITSDLAASFTGSGKSATNARRRFRRR
jgi:hypothetical protein